MRGPAELREAVAAAGALSLANLHQELAIGRELENLMIGGIIGAHPDIARVVHENAMLALRPIVTIARPAPAAQQISFTVEFEHRWRWRAAFGRRRIELRALFVVEQR